MTYTIQHALSFTHSVVEVYMASTSVGMEEEILEAFKQDTVWL